MILTPAQNQIGGDTHRFRVVNCGRRFGKTTLAIEEIKGKAVSKASRIAYIAPTFQQARDIAWEALKRELESITISVNESRLEIRVRTITGEESIIMLRGWEAIETLRGQFFDLIVIDEVALMRNFMQAWEKVVSPTLTDRRGEALFISTPQGFNHFYDLYNKQDTDPDFKSFHFTSYDNPWLPIEEIERQKKALTEDAFAQEYMADFRKMQGLVYKEFDRTRHVFSEDHKAKEARLTAVFSIVGIDWGYTNPCAILHAYKDRDAHYWIVSEYYETGKTDDEITEIARAYAGTYYYPDPAEPDRIEKLRRMRLNVRDVSKDIEAGIQSVRELFKADRIHIHSSCVNLIGELETYRYPEKKPDRNEDETPIKEDDHAVDALRYMLFMQSPIDSSNSGPKTFRPKYTNRNPQPGLR